MLLARYVRAGGRCSIPSPDRGRRSCSRSRADTTASAATSLPSIACSCGSRPRATTSSRSRRSSETPAPAWNRHVRDCPCTNSVSKHAGLVRSAGGGRAALLAEDRMRLRARGRAARRARPGGTVGPTDGALRPRLPPCASASRTGATSTSASAPGGTGRALPAALCARHAAANQGVRASARTQQGSDGAVRRCTRARLGHGFDAVITSPPYPGLIDYHEQHRYAPSCSRLDDLRERGLGAASSARGVPLSTRTSPASPNRWRGRRTRWRRGRPSSSSSTIGASSTAEILERARLRLDDRLRRHVNRRTGRRAGEYYEDVLVARR